jgi:outer membrane protein assembly factor BamB
MKILKEKITTMIALILMLTMAIPIVALQTAFAQETPTRYSFVYLGAVPNPVGVGQEVLLHIGSPHALQTAVMGWEDLTVTVTRPDGNNETLGPFKTDSTGGTGGVYVPTMAGNYTLQAHFPEQEVTADKRGSGMALGTIVLASNSEPLILVVNEDPIKYYPAHPLPVEYWARPIDAQIREWASIGGSWLVATPENKFVPYNEGPESAHILWTKPLSMGGLVGGDVSDQAFEHGDAYEGKWASRFIIGGIAIYTFWTSLRPLEYTAVDVRTGEELWKATLLDNRTISMAQLLYWSSFNHHATYRYLWVTVGTTWYAFDPYTSRWAWTITNVPSGTNVVDENGWIYRYSISTAQGRMTLWNMTGFISAEGSWDAGRNPHREYNASDGRYRTMGTTGEFGSWTTTGATARVARSYSLNFTFPTGLPGSVQRVWLNDRVIGASLSRTGVTMWAFSIKPGDEGRLLYNTTWTPPKMWDEAQVTISGFGGGWMAWSQEDYVAVLWVKETREHYGFDLQTGKYLWGPTPPQHYLDAIDDSTADVRNIAYGKLYSASVGGIVYCYDVKTGQLLWTYEATDPYSEILWANTWWLKPLFITDGKIYLGHTEHSPIDPKPRGAPFICLDAETGEEIWRADGLFRTTRWGGRSIIGDSVIVTMDTYDQRVYAIGKGPSAITVTAPDLGVPLGASVMIRGTVTDVSPGTRDMTVEMRFPNGVPAVADESMSEWMLYVYKQFPRPIDAIGVEVNIDVVDSNGNYRNIGTATSDASGFFNFEWKPDISGKYEVIATFPGSKSYYASFAQTAFVVDAAPEPTPSPTPAPALISEMYFVPAIAGLFIAILVVGALMLLMLRKRP